MRHNWERFEEVNVIVVTYVRSDGVSIPDINASPIKLLDDPQLVSVPELWVDRSIFGIDLDAIQINLLVTYYPTAGDKIIYPDGSEYRVLPLSDEIPCFRFVTTSRERLLVYVKRIRDNT